MAVECPEHLLPRNAKAAIKAAEANGWTWRCTLAAGFPPDGTELVWSVLLCASKDGVRLAGRWEGPVKDQLGWAAGWRTPPMSSIGWTEFSAELKGFPEKPPTAKQEADLEQEMGEQRAAIAALRPIAWPIEFLHQGTKDRACKGKVENRDWPGWLPCSGFASDGNPLCPDCVTGVIGETWEAPKKKKTTDQGATGDLT